MRALIEEELKALRVGAEIARLRLLTPARAPQVHALNGRTQTT